MANKRILIADDNQSSNARLQLYLERAGYEVVTVHDAETAVKNIGQNIPDLLISELALPDLDGLLLINIIRRDLRLDRLPIVILSGRTSTADKLFALESGADDFVSKPYQAREFIARVRAVLRRAQRVGPETPVPVMGEANGVDDEASVRQISE